MKTNTGLSDISTAHRLFYWITQQSTPVLLLCLVTMLTLGACLTKLVRDTSLDAFIYANHPALQNRDKVKETFGLKDPIVVAIVDESDQGIFNPETLRLVADLTEIIRQVPGVDPDHVVSLATEKNIVGDQGALLVERFYDADDLASTSMDAIQRSVARAPLYIGTLVSADWSATLISAELLGNAKATEVYEAVLAATEPYQIEGRVAIHVAGEGAVRGYLDTYIQKDARTLIPLGLLLISLVLLLSYGTLRAVLIPNLVVIGTLVSALGPMAAAGIPYYVITSTMPVMLIGIAVADIIHILGEYYSQIERKPHERAQHIVVETMAAIWRPITLTTFTTAAGFIGIFLSSDMPPIKYFGLFAACGIVFAWFYSMLLVPAILTRLKPVPSRLQRNAADTSRKDLATRLLDSLGSVVCRFPVAICVVALSVSVVAVIGAAQVEVNEERIRSFKQHEPIAVADRLINDRFHGSNYIDIMIETDATEGLFNTRYLRKMQALQQFARQLPHVNGAISIADYINQMNMAMHEDKPDYYRIPDDASLIAQYFLLYTMSGDSTDFEQEVDYDYRLANIRVYMDTSRYTHEVGVVDALRDYIDSEFNEPGLTAHLSGAVYLNYHFLKPLGSQHVQSVVIAMLLVLLMASLSFRSLVGGLFAALPVSLSVLSVYAVMGFGNIWLSIGTSMFAAISIGLGVDFAVHTLDKIAELVRSGVTTYRQILKELYPTTGRALMFNFLALFMGFGILVFSESPPGIRFGVLTSASVWVSFLASLTVLPAIVSLTRPRFLGFASKKVTHHLPGSAGV